MQSTSSRNDAVVSRACRGDREALERLLEPLYGRVYSFVCRCLGGAARAEDVFQECVLRVVQNIRTFQPGNFDAWVFTIARNLCADFFRKRGEFVSLDATGPDEEDRPLKELLTETTGLSRGQFDRKIDEIEVQHALEQLPSEQREVVLLRIYGGFSFKEIAGITGSPLGTALARMSYALKALRKIL